MRLHRKPKPEPEPVDLVKPPASTDSILRQLDEAVKGLRTAYITNPHVEGNGRNPSEQPRP